MNTRKSKSMRQEARETLKGKWGRGVGAVAILYGIMLGVELIFKLTPLGLLSFLALFITYPISFGFVYLFLNIKNEDSNVSDIFKFFTGGYWRSVGVNILFNIGIMLWSIPFAIFFIPATGMLILGESTIGIILLVISIICLVLPIVYGYIYSMTFFIAIENKDMKMMECFRLSSSIMKGNKWRLFRLQITFIWWGLLCSLTVGIGILWLLPYIETSTVIFYREVLGEYSGSNINNVADTLNTVKE